MNSQNNPIKQTSVLSAAGVKSGVMILKLIALSLLGISSGYASEALFTNVSPSVETVAKLEESPTIVRSRIASLNPQSLAFNEHSPAPEQQEKIVLNLFDDVNLNATLDRFEYASKGNYTAYGKLDNVPSGYVIFTAVNDVIVGNIFTPQSSYRILSVGKEQYAVYEIDRSKFPDEGEPRPVPDAFKETVLSRPSDTLSTADIQPAAVDDGSIIDVLVVYTTAAKTDAGGINNILAQINSAIAETNQVYANSQIRHRLRLIGTMEKAYTEGTVTQALTDVTYNMADVTTRRASLKADLVVLITKTQSGATNDYCGEGWEMNSNSSVYNSLAYSVVPRSCAVAAGNFSFAHVTARNLGAKPDCYYVNNDNSPKPYPYSHGYVNKQAKWRDVVAFNKECTDNGYSCSRIPHFANPNVKYPNPNTGDPTGVYTGSGQCESNLKLTFDNTALTVSQYNAGYCELTGYVERVNVNSGASTSVVYLRGNNPGTSLSAAYSLNNYYLSFSTLASDVKMTDASVKAVTQRIPVAIKGDKSCLYYNSQLNYGGAASYFVLAP